MSGVVVLHFWSETCNPCKVIKPALEDMKEEFADRLEWHSFNIHKDPRRTAAQFNISVVPTIVVLKNNVEIGRHSGTQIGIYYTIIRKALAA
jgi:thioredoxin 1